MSVEKRRYNLEPFPYSVDNERFAIPYTPENFTSEEQKYLAPFFTNIDKPVFVITALPEEVAGALSSRYSRTTNGLRRVFLNEYVGAILNPEKDKDWEKITLEERQERLLTKEMFAKYIEDYSTSPNMDRIANSKRARAFFRRWLNDYGDDSIQELGGAHLCIEGISSIAIEEIIDQRVGLSPLVKSSRFVYFGEKRPDGQFQYIVPGEVRDTELESEFRQLMDELFTTYRDVSEPYLEYINNKYPQGEDESDSAFRSTRSAKRFDDIRDLLPFCTQNNIALYGNGRAFESLLNRLMYHDLGECRWLGKTVCNELAKVIPSFVERAQEAKGAEVQIYKSNVRKATSEELESTNFNDKEELQMTKWAKLVSYTLNAEVPILAAQMFTESNKYGFDVIREKIMRMSVTDRREKLTNILKERRFGKETGDRFKDRFKKVMRSFENAHYLFAIWARGGDYRDLHRHRQNTQARMKFTTNWGYDLESEVKESPFIEKIESVLQKADSLYKKLEKISPDVAQYVVPFGYIQHWYLNLTAKEIYWMIELRTGPQGRPHYRKICQQIAEQVKAVDPVVFGELMVDNADYSLSRREANIKRDRKNG